MYYLFYYLTIDNNNKKINVNAKFNANVNDIIMLLRTHRAVLNIKCI